MEVLGDFLKTFLEGSVDRVIYRDYIVNRRFFIYCSLALLGQSDHTFSQYMHTSLITWSIRPYNRSVHARIIN